MTAKSRARLLVLPTVLVLALIVVFPMVFSITVSLRDYDIRRPEHPFYGMKNYGWFLSLESAWDWLWLWSICRGPERSFSRSFWSP